MHPPLYLLLPFLGAFIYALGNVFQKRAFHEGAGVMTAFALNNLVLGLAFLPMLFWSSDPLPRSLLWQPMVAGAAFFAGSIVGLVALRVGDVSLVTPLLGTKVILVAAISTLIFHRPLSPGQGLAAGLTTLGVFVMGLTDFHPRRRLGLTTALAVLCSFCFAICDTLIQQWAVPFGTGQFVPLLFGTLALLGLGIVAWHGRELLRVPAGAWKWLAAASAATVAQAMLVTFSIALWRDATGVNVVYALRGLWGLALVWGVGHWFGNTERRDTGSWVMGFRLAGAVLILGAVILAVLAGSQPRPVSGLFPALPDTGIRL